MIERHCASRPPERRGGQHSNPQHKARSHCERPFHPFEFTDFESCHDFPPLHHSKPPVAAQPTAVKLCGTLLDEPTRRRDRRRAGVQPSDGSGSDYPAEQKLAGGTHTPLPQQELTMQITPLGQSALVVQVANPAHWVEPSTHSPPPSAVEPQTPKPLQALVLHGVNVLQV